MAISSLSVAVGGVLRLGQQRLVGGEAGLALGLAGPGRHADPLQLALEGALPGRVGLLLRARRCLLLLEPGRVVALERDAGAAVELEDPAGHVVEEVAVVGDGDDGAGVVLEEALEPRHRLGVEVVGGLVEQQQVGLASSSRHSATRRRSPPESVATSASPGGQAQGVHGDLEVRSSVPAVGRVDLVLQVGLLGEQLVEVGVGVAHGLADLVEAVEQGLGLGHAVHRRCRARPWSRRAAAPGRGSRR